MSVVLHRDFDMSMCIFVNMQYGVATKWKSVPTCVRKCRMYIVHVHVLMYHLEFLFHKNGSIQVVVENIVSMYNSL